jgi:Na+/H+-translocating membrane pyrophosphatase
MSFSISILFSGPFNDSGNGKRHGLESAEITDPLIFAGLLLGAMLPYAFSAFTMKSVGKAA